MLIGLYGAGTLGRLIGRHLQQPFVFVDDTPHKAGTVVDGHEVITLGEFARRASRSDARLVVCIYQPGFEFDRKRQEVETAYPGLDCRVFTELLLSEAVQALPFLFFERREAIAAKAPRYARLRDRLADELSRQTLDAHIRFRMSGRFGDLIYTARRDVPFLIDCLPRDVEYVDVGAFDGDTAEEFVGMTKGRFHRIYLVEPDPANAARAAQRMSRIGVADRVAIKQVAVSGRRGRFGFSATGNVGSLLDPSAELQVPTVLLSDFDSGKPLFMKLDIEGSEVQAIAACAEFIARRRIFLAISVYHRPDDLLDISSLIHGLDAGYRLFLRCHGKGGEDLMLYAIPAAAACTVQ